MLEWILLIDTPRDSKRRSNIGTIIVALISRFVIDTELSFLYLALFFAILNLPLDLPEHHWEAAETILISELVLHSKPILVLVQSFFPLPSI